MADNIIEIDGLADFNQKLAEYKDKFVLIDFWAVWCTPCKLIDPVVKDLAQEYSNQLVLFKVDTDANQELSIEYGVMSIPTLMLWKPETAGQPREKVQTVGFRPKPHMLQWMQDEGFDVDNKAAA